MAIDMAWNIASVAWNQQVLCGSHTGEGHSCPCIPISGKGEGGMPIFLTVVPVPVYRSSRNMVTFASFNRGVSAGGKPVYRVRRDLFQYGLGCSGPMRFAGKMVQIVTTLKTLQRHLYW